MMLFSVVAFVVFFSFLPRIDSAILFSSSAAYFALLLSRLYTIFVSVVRLNLMFALPGFTLVGFGRMPGTALSCANATIVANMNKRVKAFLNISLFI